MPILNKSPILGELRNLTVCLSTQTVANIKRLKDDQELSSMSAAYRLRITNRKVTKRVFEYSLEKTMWELSGIRGEIDLMVITLMLIRKKVSPDSDPVNYLDTNSHELLRVLAQLSDTKKMLFEQIAKLSFIWLTK